MKSLIILAGIGLMVGCTHRSQLQEPGPTPPPPPGASMRGDETARQNATTLDQLLVGRISGVTVQPAPGGGIIVRMGGPTSFYSGQQPLFVIDGVPTETNGTLTWLDPHDVESIRALKGADAAIYGVRGANGVIVIRTKGSH